jgi:MATE family multidrug resistance protein
VAVNLFFTAAGSRESTLVLAVNTLLMTLFTIFSYFMDGFAYAAEALSGKYYGAGNREAFREVVKRTMGFGVVVAILFTLLYIVGGENFLSLLTSDRQVVAAAGAYMNARSAPLLPSPTKSNILYDNFKVYSPLFKML